MNTDNPPPENKSFNKMSIYEKYVVIVGIAGQSMHYIQAYKIYSTKSADDISMLAYLICFFLLVNWMIYGFVKRAPALIIAEFVGIFGVIAIIIGTIFYS